jgi:hypothetical protein
MGFRGEPLWVNMKKISDGTSHTLMIGEKHVPLKGYGYYQLPSGGELTYDSSMYNGDDFNVVARFAGPGFGFARSPDEAVNRNFGGLHPGVCQFVYADGSVHAIPVEISEAVLGQLANRQEGLALGKQEF